MARLPAALGLLAALALVAPARAELPSVFRLIMRQFDRDHRRLAGAFDDHAPETRAKLPGFLRRLEVHLNKFPPSLRQDPGYLQRRRQLDALEAKAAAPPPTAPGASSPMDDLLSPPPPPTAPDAHSPMDGLLSAPPPPTAPGASSPMDDLLVPPPPTFEAPSWADPSADAAAATPPATSPLGPVPRPDPAPDLSLPGGMAKADQVMVLLEKAMPTWTAADLAEARGSHEEARQVVAALERKRDLHGGHPRYAALLAHARVLHRVLGEWVARHSPGR